VWISARFDVFAALLGNSEDLQNTHCRLANGDPIFRKSLLSTFSRWSEKRTLEVEVASFSETPDTLHQSIRCHIPVVFSNHVDLCSALLDAGGNLLQVIVQKWNC